MKSFKKVLATTLAAAMVITAVPVSSANAAAQPKLSATKKTYYAGKSYKLKVTTPSSWKSVKVTSKSSKKSVATVKTSKKTITVKAVKAGKSTVTVKVTGKNKKGKKLSKTLKCAVTVKTPKITAAPAQTVKVGTTASVKPSVKPASAKLSYKSSDAAVAAVDANGVVTGVAVGKATVTVTAKVGTKTLTATTDVTVEANEVVLSDVKQTASNAFTATFSDDASKTVKKEDFTVEKTDKTATLAVQSLTFAADGKTATVKLASNMENGVKYNITCQKVTKELTAEIGEVAKVEILTTKAQQGKVTPIEFKLMDANGIDVTPAKNVDSTCQINVTGTYSSAEKDTPSKATITMTAVGDKAEVEITYDSGVKDAALVTAKGEIECVKAEAEKGTATFKTEGDLNSKSECEKFYKETSDKEVSVAEGVEKTVYFCAVNGTTAVDYDKYEVESSDETKFSVSATKDTGKYLKIVVTGNNAGTAAINVNASKYGVVTQYQIPVTVIKDELAVSMTAEIDRKEMSNSPDPDYEATITVKFYDAAGKEVTKDVAYSVEITNTSDKLSSASADGVTISGNKFKIDATNAALSGDYTKVKPKTYQLRVKGQDTVADRTFTKNLNVTVKKLPEKAFTTGAAMDYKLEMAKTTVDEEAAVKNVADGANKVRAYAECGGLFAGYVDNAGLIALDNIKATDATKIVNVGVAASYGNEYYKDATDNGQCDLVYSNSYNSTPGTPYTRTTAKMTLPAGAGNRSVTYNVAVAQADLVNDIKLPSVTSGSAIYPISLSGCQYGDSTAIENTGNGYVVMKNGKETDFQTLAKTGRWNVELIYNKYDSSKPSNTGAEVVKSNSFSVTGLKFNPTVTAGDRNVSALSFDEIVKALSTNVDMNNDNGSNISIVGLIYTDKNKKMVCAHTTDSVDATNTDGTKTFIKYAVVVDTVKVNATVIPVYYCVPLNVTFTLK